MRHSAAAAAGAAGVALRLAGLVVLSVALTGRGRPMEAESAACQGLMLAAEGGVSATSNAYVLHICLAAALTAQGCHQEALFLLATTHRPCTSRSRRLRPSRSPRPAPSWPWGAATRPTRS